MRQHQRRIGGKSAEYLSCLGIVERVKTALKRFAVKRQYTRTRGRFAAIQVCCVLAKYLLNIRWIQPLQNITDRRVGGWSLPANLESFVQPFPVRLDERTNASVRIGSSHNRQNGKQQNIRQLISLPSARRGSRIIPRCERKGLNDCVATSRECGGRHRFRTFLPPESPFRCSTSNC